MTLGWCANAGFHQWTLQDMLYWHKSERFRSSTSASTQTARCEVVSVNTYNFGRKTLTVLVLLMMNLMVPTHVYAEDPCPTGNPMSPSDVRGATWLGRVVDVDTTVEIQPVYSVAVEHVYAGGSSVLHADVTVQLVSAACWRVVGLETGRDYVISVPQVPSQDGLFRSTQLAAWQVDADAATFVLMYPDKNIDPSFARAVTVRQALLLVAPQADLPETDILSTQPSQTSGDITPVYLAIIFALATLASLLLRRHRYA
jgi:hypothetical protein